MSNPQQMLSAPFHYWNDIPWSHFGYAYVGSIGAIFIFPIIFLGILFIEALSERTQREIKGKYRLALSYVFLFVMFFSVPTAILGMGVWVLLLGEALLGYSFIIFSVLLVLSYSTVLPTIFYLIGEANGVQGVIRFLDFRTVLKESIADYRSIVITMAVANVIVWLGSIFLMLTLVGWLIFPLLLLWYIYVCVEVYSRFRQMES